MKKLVFLIYLVLVIDKLLSISSSRICNESTDAKLILLKNNSDSKCLDGSPPGYYLKNGLDEGETKWLIYFEGGGWCFSAINCYSRSKGELGSSNNYEPCMSGMKFYRNLDKKSNPLFYNWNIVHVKYCDSSSYSGDAKYEYKGKTLYFYGRANRDATIVDLLERGMNTASDVVISGCSAGALGVFMGLDHMRDLIWKTNQNIRVFGFADSGYFYEYSPGRPPPNRPSHDEYAMKDKVLDYPDAMQNIFKRYNMSFGINSDCIQHYSASITSTNLDDRSKLCVLAQNVVHFITTPLFLFQPIYDSWQIWHIVGEEDIITINSLGQNVTKSIIEKVIDNRSYNGAFLDHCAHHCMGCSMSGEDPWNGFRVLASSSTSKVPVSPAEAFTKWYINIRTSYSKIKAQLYNQPNDLKLRKSLKSSNDNNIRRHLYDQGGDYPCYSCCICRA